MKVRTKDMLFEVTFDYEEKTVKTMCELWAALYGKA